MSQNSPGDRVIVYLGQWTRVTVSHGGPLNSRRIWTYVDGVPCAGIYGTALNAEADPYAMHSSGIYVFGSSDSSRNPGDAIRIRNVSILYEELSRRSVKVR